VKAPHAGRLHRLSGRNPPPVSETTPLLQLRGISKAFGSVQALSDVDFEVRNGEVMALVGDNGAGKSTLIKCIAGIHGYDSGEIVGQVLEADPRRKLVQTFDARWDQDVAPDGATRLAWEIEEAGPGMCKLTVVHDGFPSRNATYESVGGGMPYILSGLKTLLETGTPIHDPDTHVAA